MTSPRPHSKPTVESETEQSPGLIFTKVHLNRQFCSLFLQEIISPFIRTMSTKKELQEIASYLTSLSESQGKWPGHLNIPCENVPWVLEPHNHPNSVDLSSFSQVVGFVSQGPTSTQLEEQLTPTSHKTPILATELRPGSQISKHEGGLISARTALPYCQVTSMKSLTFLGLISLYVKWVP